ncbi:MAG TPA: GNAT family N-acetyltransferase, partial [candidate division Zixibacteria bacterium]|nr:GNAT family N-acetyltransferase [candidate division Zixibacteria bacterium]
PTAAAKAVGKLSETTQKPILAAWLGGAAMRDGTQILIDSGVPAYKTPEQAIRAFMTLVSYSRNLETLYETPKDMLVDFNMDREQIRAKFVSKYFINGNVLSEDISKLLIETYGIPVTRPHRSKTSDEAVRLANEIGFPVALKIFSPDITHKTDVGGVALSLEDDAMVRESFDRIISSVRQKRPEARIEGVTVQKMITKGDSTELIIGIKKDPVFGTVMMAGMGGITAELFSDKALGFPPLNERLARRMLESLKIWPLLCGYRGRPKANTDKLIETLIRLSYLAADYPEISELDINPLFVGPQETIALDARIVIEYSLVGKAFEPYSHLALRPYPEKYVKTSILKDGTEITLRPIKPEDEPLWMNLLASCSKESIYLRFRYFFQWASHEVAARYCYIDYDREIAIVAEISDGDGRKLIGVGRLIADPDHESVEYAVLIADAWQQKELGKILTEYCLEIARKWKLRKMVAVTTTDNRPMISVFKKLGFEVTYAADSTVEVSKDIG